MQPDYLIVLFSKYSTSCQSLLELYDEHLMSTIKFVCIDNAAIRKRVMEDKTLQIKQVPCVLFVYPQNKMEKFEGPQVYAWLRQKLTAYLPSPPSPETQSQAPSFAQPTPTQPQPIPLPPPPPSAIATAAQPIVSSPEIPSLAPPSHGTAFTSIEDLSPLETTDAVQQVVNKSTKKEKSIVERAQEMAAMREGVDKPAHLQMQEQQSRQLDAAINGRA